MGIDYCLQRWPSLMRLPMMHDCLPGAGGDFTSRAPQRATHKIRFAVRSMSSGLCRCDWFKVLLGLACGTSTSIDITIWDTPQCRAPASHNVFAGTSLVVCISFSTSA